MSERGRGSAGAKVPRTRATLRATVGTVAAVATLALAGTPVSHAATTDYRGAFQCSDGRPLAGARVELWQQHVRWLPKVPPNVELRNVTRADGNGAWAFRVGGDESNWYIRVVLVGEDAAVRDFPWPWNWFAETLRSQNDRPLRDYGTQLVSGYQCGVWNGFSDAGREYREEIHSAPPQGVTVVRAGAITAGVPFTFYDEVWWPSGYPVYDSGGISTAKHEFAHVFRHIFDAGSLGGLHFAEDALFNWYLRNHSASSCDPTNSAFAFNEGWAEYWSGEVMAPCPNANTGLNERNVAASLQRLQRTCGLLTRERMVQVLAQNPLRIHSIDEFTRALNCTPFRVKLRRPRPPKPIGELLKERRAVFADGRRFVKALGRAVKRLKRETAAAERLSQRPIPCPLRPCAEELELKLKPVLLAGQLAQARAVKQRFAFLADRAAMRRFGQTSLIRQLRRLEATGRAAVTASARIAGRTLAKALRAARRLGADQSSLSILARAQAEVARRDGSALAGMAPIPPVALKEVGPTPPIEPPLPPPPPGAKPDLVIDRLYLTSALGWEWNVELRNAGDADAPASKIGITQTSLTEVLVDAPALAAGASVTVKTECPYGSLAEATGRADATTIVDESNEANNDRTSEFGGTGGRCRYP